MLDQSIGKYRIIQQLGKGYSSTTYRAYDSASGETVALKVFRRELTQSTESRQNLLRQIQSASRFRHPNMPGLCDYGEENDIIYFVEKFIDGGSIEQIIAGKPLKFSEIINIARQIANVLDFAHDIGILHRDVTSFNILVAKDGKALLVDWASCVEMESSYSSWWGHAPYASPEQGLGKTDLTPASDVYSLAVVLYEMLTGHLPYESRDPRISHLKQLHDPMLPVRGFRGDIPEAVEQVLTKALASDPHARYQHAGDLVDAFEDALGNIVDVQETPTAPPPPQYRILLLSADPTDAARLRLGEEVREIQEKLQMARMRDQFELYQRFSVRPADIGQALLDIEPQIVHFSGHGMADGSICLEDSLGKVHPVQPDALAALFEQFAHQVKCVVLNACYSATQANAIAEHIEHVIGMKTGIGDKAAITFSIGFYQALGANRTFEDAFRLGCVQIRLHGIPEHLTPVFINKANAPT